jgi:hypothetical protein
MKTLFRTRTYLALATLSVLAILVVQAWAQSHPKPTRPPVPSASKATHVLIIGDFVATKHDQAAFEAVLDKLSSDATIDLYSYDNGTCKHHTAPHSHKVCVRTDSKLVPESAANEAGKVTFIQNRTTVQVGTKSWSDISAVVNELQ